MSRSKAREKAFQFLFQLDLNEIDQMSKSELAEEFMKDAFSKQLIDGVIKHRESLDRLISNHLENWTFNRLASVEKTVLRLATFEILYMNDIPVAVSINEAIKIANRYGSDQSGKFVNGVLSKIIK